MLAQSFKTAAELEISGVGYNALVTVLGMLDRGEITAEEFDMDIWWERQHDKRGRFCCGSIGCLGGWAVHAARQAGHHCAVFSSPAHATNELYELFHPCSDAAWHATCEQAAAALRNYLTTGMARWPEALKP